MKRTLLLAAALAVFAAQPVEAKILKSVVNKGGGSIGTTLAAIPLNKNNDTTVTFNVPTAGLVGITFSAECYESESGWVQIDIVVDGLKRAGTAQSDDAFCSSTEWVTASRTIAIELSSGPHTLQIRAQTTGGSTNGYIEDSDLVIFD